MLDFNSEIAKIRNRDIITEDKKLKKFLIESLTKYGQILKNSKNLKFEEFKKEIRKKIKNIFKKGKMKGKWKLVHNVIDNFHVVLSLKKAKFFKKSAFSTKNSEQVIKPIKQQSYIKKIKNRFLIFFWYNTIRHNIIYNIKKK